MIPAAGDRRYRHGCLRTPSEETRRPVGANLLDGLVADDRHTLHHALGREEIVRDDVLGRTVVPKGDGTRLPTEPALDVDDLPLPVETPQEPTGLDVFHADDRASERDVHVERLTPRLRV